MHVRGTPHSPSTLRVFTMLLLAAHTLFLWMFFSADSVTRVSAVGALGHPVDGLAAARFAAQWKHGMAGNSPLYMPGFFAVGFLTWLWAIGRPLRALAAEWTVVLAIAFVAALILTPVGAARAMESFERTFGITRLAVSAGPSWASLGASTFTLFAWTTAIVGLQLSIDRRSVEPMALPVLLHFILLFVRPWAINDFTTQWFGDVSRGLTVAVVSLVAVPVLVTGLAFYQVRRETTSPVEARA